MISILWYFFLAWIALGVIGVYVLDKIEPYKPQLKVIDLVEFIPYVLTGPLIFIVAILVLVVHLVGVVFEKVTSYEKIQSFLNKEIRDLDKK